MLLRKTQDQASIRIGELLVRAELLEQSVVDAAVSLAGRMRVPIGRILSMDGHVSEAVLQAALEVQSRAADSLIDIEVGIQALQLVARRGLTLEAALEAASRENSSEAVASGSASDVQSNTAVGQITPASEAVPKSESAVDTPVPSTLMPPSEPDLSTTTVPSTESESVIPMMHLEQAALELVSSAMPLEMPELEPASSTMPLETTEPEPVTSTPAESVRRASSTDTGKFDIFVQDPSEELLTAEDETKHSPGRHNVERSDPEIDKHREVSAAPASDQAAQEVSAVVLPGRSNRLGDLLVSAGMIDANALSRALDNGKVTGLPLGLVLVGMGLINHSLLNNALTAQRLIRSGAVSRENALHALRVAHVRRQTIHESLEDYDWYARATICTVDVGELMHIADILTTDQLLNLREQELLEEKPLESLVVSGGVVDTKFVEAAKQLLAMVEDATLSENEAIVILRRMKRLEGDPAPESLLSLLDIDSDEFEVELRWLLEDAGLLSSQQLKAACALALGNKTSLAKTLRDTGLLEDWQLECVLKCKESIDTGMFEKEQAVIGLLYALEQELTFEDTVVQFGWVLPPGIAS